MSAQKQPEIFIHTGMGKTGSTYLQYNVFPKLRGICYTQRTKFRKAPGIIDKGKYDRYLVSGEMEYKKLERHMAEFSARYPRAKPIIILRRHDEWIASQFRRFIKNGYTWSFNEFIALNTDENLQPSAWLNFYFNIEILEKYFSHKPLVLFYDELREDPGAFIGKLVTYLGAELEFSSVNLSPRHRSYNEKQLRAIYTVSKKINLVKNKSGKNKTLRVLKNLHKNVVRYLVILVAPLVPENWLSDDPVFPSRKALDDIRNAYREDWEKCHAYAAANNPVL